ncbi:MAG: hypothetical protein ACYC5N_10880, partial [Endomicrobiales bacterium]
MGLARFSLLLLAALFILFAPVLFNPGSITGNYGDIYLHYYPLKHLVLEHLQNGRMPLWDPYIFAGQPLLANPQSAVFYPLSAVFYFLPLPFAFALFFFTHFFLAGLFMYLLLSHYRMGRTASALGSISFALCSFLVYKVPSGHPVALSGYVWLPLAVLVLEKMKDAPSRGLPFLLGAVLSFQFLSGHTFPVYITAVFIALHLAWHGFRYWRALLAAAAVSVLFSA